MIKKLLQKIFKTISYSFFLKIHGKIIKSITSDSDHRIEVKAVNIEKNLKYNIYKITEGRLYTDRIHDTAVILDNKIVEEPSFQFRWEALPFPRINNSKIEDNVVFTKGTPRILKDLKGTVLSLLTGGGGNNNYWHWLFDVLPRLGLCSKYINLEKINYFLLPSLLRKFQNETLDCLNIPINKRLSSEKFRHIKAKELIVTDHPVVVTGDSSNDIQNVPHWICLWLKNNFLNKNIATNKKVKNKIYIDRTDTTATQPQLRLLTNENEIKKYLLENNFILVKLHEINFKNQVNLFQNAECIVGLHGAGLANIVFCEPRTKVIEMRGSNAGFAIENLAKKNDLNYHSVIIEATDIRQYDFPNQHGSIEIPINQLSEILKN